MTRSGLAFSCVLLKQPKGFTAVELYLDSAIDNNFPYLRPVPSNEDPRKTEPASIAESFNIRVDLSVQVHA